MFWAGEDEPTPWAVVFAITLGVPALLFLVFLYAGSRSSQHLAAEMGDVLRVMGNGKDCSLWAALHPHAKQQSDKACVAGFERCLREHLGRPTTVKSGTVQLLDGAPQGFLRCGAIVEFEKGPAVVDVCWEEATNKIAAVQVEPEKGPLPLHEHVNPSVFEQKTDSFLASLFSRNVERALDVMHENLRNLMSMESLQQQRSTVLRHMGYPTNLPHDPEATYHSCTSRVERAKGSIPGVHLSATILGDTQDSVASFFWVIQGMQCKLLKFEVKTTGVPKRETVFVHPDGTRIESYD